MKPILLALVLVPLLLSPAQPLDEHVGDVGGTQRRQRLGRRRSRRRNAEQAGRELHVLTRRERLVQHAVMRHEPDGGSRWTMSWPVLSKYWMISTRAMT